MNLRTFLRPLKRFLARGPGRPAVPHDIASDDAFMRLYRRCAGFTMTSPERMYALYHAVRHVVRNGIPGDIVECGVWRGGSSMLAASTLRELGDTQRTVYLYDTFTGMPAPGAEDGSHARAKWDAKVARGDADRWCYADLDDVRRNMRTTGYPEDRLVFVEGKVEETIPRTIPERIALLRLDTDWYASTKHELEHLWSRVTPGGALIIDDYGAWEGARRAVDEFFRERPLLLARIDATGRLALKPVSP